MRSEYQYAIDRGWEVQLYPKGLYAKRTLENNQEHP